ncbi:hypothetical protein [Diaphorobacter sp. LR2014-1]|uniref:hypothetical protein n=1 Tax=Diaphorobacter sp. LR2014-1 TaxID=1933219 RepID=UPI000CDAC414|nr:hypothetical protein [Diaphorobacter sp. LR2014-1]POR10838.1 hypothetical protein BV908_08915 [Diaphorobacter sp. LR2014-1]
MSQDRPTQQDRRAAQLQAKLFGSKSAFTFETDCLKSSLATVAVEAATCTGPQTYDWADKLTFQLTRRELPVFTAMMAGYGGPNTLVEFLAHGPEKNKNLRVMDQGASLLISLRQGQRNNALRMHLADTYQVLSLCMKALSDNDPHLDQHTILEFCRRSLVVAHVPAKSPT